MHLTYCFLLGKNADLDLVPCDKNRLYLSTTKQLNDYINAVQADSFKMKNTFILTQVPLDHTIIDFWRLINDHCVSTVLLLNHLDGQHQYWPANINESLQFGSINVMLVKELIDNHEGIVERHFQISNESDISENRVVKQYHLNSLDDKHFHKIEVLQLLKDLIKSTAAPVLVQCINGVDRSSLFVTFHNILEMIETSQPVDVISTIKRLRSSTSHCIRSQTHLMTVYNWTLASIKHSGYYNM